MTPRRPALLLLLAALVVRSAGAGEPLDFKTRILPLLTKAGCNTGSCHGAAVGQGGFKLSLLGYDPSQDHANLTRDLGGRRLDVESPAESLFLRKGTDELDHEGGRRIKLKSSAYRVLLEWIAAGAPYGSADLRVTGIQIEPADVLVPEPGRNVQLRVTASLSDGQQQDVTALALYTANDDAVAAVSSSGLVTTRDRGLTSIMVRYCGQAAAARIAVPFDHAAPAADAFAIHSFIDGPVLAELQRMRLPPSPLSDDAEFLRRVFLDLTGRLPEPEEAHRFLSEAPSHEKRQRLIAALLARGEFVDLWTMKFGDWLLVDGKRSGEAATRTYHAWIREQIAKNRPLDQFVLDLLLAQGSLTQNGPANFYTLANDPRDLGEQVSSMFLGTQIACARCHAHPSDRWTQSDYHAFAACFARVARHGDTIVVVKQGEVEHPKTLKPVAPRPLGGSVALGGEDDRRIELASWLVSPANPLFARNLVNRIWRSMLGRGLVEPVDDLRPTNPATNPALLDALAAEFVQHHFDLRWLVSEIANSTTYQLTSRATEANRKDDRLFSHAFLKPLPAQVMADVIAQVTDVPDQFSGQPDIARAVQLIGAQTPSYALDVLGRCTRERSCETPGRAGGGMAQALHLVNGPTINGKLRGGVLSQLVAGKPAPRALVDELYLRALSRPASALEQDTWAPLLSQADDLTEAAEDLLWALLNSREFAFNH